MIERALSKTDIRTLLDRLSERLSEKRAFAKFHVVGSACIALAYERERTTLDIDVRVDAGHRALEEAIREIAQEHDLPQRWLNDQSRGFIPEHDDLRSPTLYESQSLVVTGASGEYLLAMKLEASRNKDTEDVRYLLQHLGIEKADAALELHRTLFPNSRRTPQARAMLARLARDDDRLAPPTPIEELRRQWQHAMAADTFPRYEFEQSAEGLTLTVQDAQNARPRVLGNKLSLYTLALRERTHRGWPAEATDVIMQFIEEESARRESGTPAASGIQREAELKAQGTCQRH